MGEHLRRYPLLGQLLLFVDVPHRVAHLLDDLSRTRKKTWRPRKPKVSTLFQYRTQGFIGKKILEIRDGFCVRLCIRLHPRLWSQVTWK